MTDPAEITKPDPRHIFAEWAEANGLLVSKTAYDGLIAGLGAANFAIADLSTHVIVPIELTNEQVDQVLASMGLSDIARPEHIRRVWNELRTVMLNPKEAGS